MKRIVGFFAVLCISAAMLCSCKQNHSQKPVFRAVTQVDIVTEYEDQLIHRHYNTPEKMRPVLLYLRLLKWGEDTW